MQERSRAVHRCSLALLAGAAPGTVTQFSGGVNIDLFGH
jgi:hypothetical protein